MIKSVKEEFGRVNYSNFGFSRSNTFQKMPLQFEIEDSQAKILSDT